MNSQLDSHGVARFIHGCGGHAKVVIDAWRCAGGGWHGCLDDDRAWWGRTFEGVSVLEPDRMLPLPVGATVHVAIGSNDAREFVAERAIAAGFKLMSVVHPAAAVSKSAELGAGIFVAATGIIGPSSSVGMCCIINHGAVVDHDCMVGSWTHVAPGAIIGGAAQIGSRVLIGAGAVILPGISVADDATIGAGAVVTTHVPRGATMIGLPARIR